MKAKNFVVNGLFFLTGFGLFNCENDKEPPRFVQGITEDGDLKEKILIYDKNAKDIKVFLEQNNIKTQLKTSKYEGTDVYVETEIPDSILDKFGNASIYAIDGFGNKSDTLRTYQAPRPIYNGIRDNKIEFKYDNASEMKAFIQNENGKITRLIELSNLNKEVAFEIPEFVLNGGLYKFFAVGKDERKSRTYKKYFVKFIKEGI